MKAAELITEKTLTEVQIVRDRIVNLVFGKEVVGLDVDTSFIPNYTPLRRYTSFTIRDNILECMGLKVNLNEINVLH